MPSPWEQTPQQAWANNFQDRIESVTQNIQDNGVEDYKSGVREAFDQAGVDIDMQDTAYAVSRFEEAVDKFDTQAMKRTTVLAAAQYVENENPDVDTGGLGNVDTYEDTSVDQFETATVVLGDKFIQNWGKSYTQTSEN
jgi:hypothetical protein